MSDIVKPLIRRGVIAGGLAVSRGLSALGLMQGARGRGSIFTLHHVRPASTRLFPANAHLDITPRSLDAAIVRLKRDGYRFLALADLPAHLASGDARPVAVFTLDDAYRDNLDHAAPVFAHHHVPFTVFATEGFVRRTHSLWWETLAELLQTKPRLTFDFGDGPERIHLQTPQQMQAAFARFARFVHAADEAVAVAAIDRLSRAEGLDPLALTERLTLDAAGLATLARRPFAAIGAHTVSHRALARLEDAEAETEILRSVEAIAGITGTRPTTLAYPYGDARAVSARDMRLAERHGLLAVTTQPGTLGGHAHPAALPRISINGHFQAPGDVAALASGIPFRLMKAG
ncbi:polysaccharide deacetylase family protein [Rhizobium sp. Leaf341]|uniref:polysaccharide deacetylase family protein n=1 Tax=Rhizobium sp. Leaf341 TaxID=1736344 RepID=UPI0007159029|nr:polysaccharide deacetylase family protein [Rhizobium sp. Leaf341]KQR77429.1 polysaccharide deacetylase [Rhizobium sp. Leaf341]